MSRYAAISDITKATTVFVQSADPVDLQNRVNAALSALPPNDFLASVYLAGGGNGHTFVVEITSVSTAGGTFIGGPAQLTVSSVAVRCYMAADKQELGVQRAKVVPTLADPMIYDEMVAGASKGTRFMGLIVSTDT